MHVSMSIAINNSARREIECVGQAPKLRGTEKIVSKVHLNTVV